MNEKTVLIETIKEALEKCNDLELLYFIQGILNQVQPQNSNQIIKYTDDK